MIRILDELKSLKTSAEREREEKDIKENQHYLVLDPENKITKFNKYKLVDDIIIWVYVQKFNASKIVFHPK